MTSSAIFDGLETGLDVIIENQINNEKKQKNLPRRQSKKKIKLKEKSKKNKKKKNMKLAQINFSFTISALLPTVIKWKLGSFNYISISRSVLSCYIIVPSLPCHFKLSIHQDLPWKRKIKHKHWWGSLLTIYRLSSVCIFLILFSMHSHKPEKENLYNNQGLHVLILIFLGHSLYPSIVHSITDMVFVNRVFYRERGELYDKNEERS